MIDSVIRLTTYDDSDAIELDPRDVAFIARELTGRVSIRREIGDDRFKLNAGPYAGLIRLPTGALLRSAPRIPTQNIFRMLAVAHSLPSIRLEDTVQLGSIDEMLEFVADYFADQLEERIEQGLFRAYIGTEENLSVVRGRIQTADDVRQNYVLRHRTYCRFSELTWDVPENQVLRYVAHQLSGWPFSRDLQARLQQLDRRMDEVSLTPFRADDVDRFSYNRLNAGYEPLHRLCRLLLQDMSLSEERGPHDFVSFLLDLNLLFEQFIGQMFVKAVPSHLARVELQRRAALGRQFRDDGSVRRWGVIRPDIELARAGDVVAVLDTKYKKTSGESIKNPDFYQVMSYCVAESTPFGGLIYPTSEFAEDDEITIRNSDIRIRRFAVDLNVPSSQLISEAEALVSRVSSWMGQDLSLSA